MSLRILHYLPSIDLRAGGPIRAVFDLSDALVRQGHSVTIATTHAPPDAPATHDTTDAATAPRIVLLEPPLVRRAWMPAPARARLRTLLEQHDLLHLHGVWDVSNWQLARIARAARKPYFVSVRGMLDDWSMQQKRAKKRLFHALCVRAFLNGAARIHLTADGELEQASKWFAPGKGTVISNLLNLAPFRTPPGPALARSAFNLPADQPVVLFLSRIHYKKGAEVLLRAAGITQAARLPALFVFAGPCDDDYRASLNALAQQLRITDSVRFVGHVAGDLKISLYQAAHVMALPTSQENFGFVFPESLAAGTPVITTKGVDIWPSLERGGGSLIVDRTPEAFAQAITTLVRDPALRDRMARQGREHCFVEYDELRIVREFEAMYAASIAPARAHH